MTTSSVVDHYHPDLIPYLEKIATELATTIGDIRSLELDYAKGQREQIIVGLYSCHNEEYIFEVCADGALRRPDNKA